MVLQTTVNPSTRQRHIQLTRATKAQLETMEKQASEARSNVIRRSAGELLWASLKGCEFQCWRVQGWPGVGIWPAGQDPDVGEFRLTLLSIVS